MNIDYWQLFSESGAVADYLKYKNSISSENQEKENNESDIKDKRNSDKGSKDKRKR